MADDPRGPWQMAPGPFLDGDRPCRRYAARIVETADGLRHPRLSADPGDGDFVGEITDPDAGDDRADGWLKLG